jgi:hypothetical protein
MKSRNWTDSLDKLLILIYEITRVPESPSSNSPSWDFTLSPPYYQYDASVAIQLQSDIKVVILYCIVVQMILHFSSSLRNALMIVLSCVMFAVIHTVTVYVWACSGCIHTVLTLSWQLSAQLSFVGFQVSRYEEFCLMVCWKQTDVSEEHVTSIFSVEE